MNRTEKYRHIINLYRAGLAYIHAKEMILELGLCTEEEAGRLLSMIPIGV